MKKNKTNDEIDILELFQIISKNLYTIILISLITVSLSLGYLLINKNYYKIKIQINIQPIDFFEDRRHDQLNFLNTILTSRYLDLGSVPFTQERHKNKLLNKKYLLELFLILIKEKELLVKAMDKSKFIDKDNFENREAYLDEINKISSEIEFVFLKNDKILSVKIFERNLNKWKELLKNLSNEINLEAKNILLEDFKKFKDINQIILEKRIEKIKYTQQKRMELELSFLKEQLSIAKEFNIPFNSVEIQSNSPHYLKGYKVIEKEIKLLESKIDKEEINEKDLNELGYNIFNDKLLDEVEVLFKSIVHNKNFRVARLDYENILINRNYYNFTISIIIISLIVGLFLGVIYSLIRKNLRN